jgi:hypothetical protein
LAKIFLTDEDKRNLRDIALELKEIRKLIEGLTEKMVDLSDKELMRNFNASQIDLKENEVLRCRVRLQEQVDRAQKEL